MRDAPCGLDDCPIVDADAIDRRRLRTDTLTAGTEWFRAARHEHARQAFTPPGLGNARFSPLDSRGHTYAARIRSAALLESVLHETSGPNPRIYAAALARSSISRLRVRRDVTVIDLRDDALSELGLDRSELTGADAVHYPCTRRVAERIVGSKSSVGMSWTSRQGMLHAERNPDGLASEVLHHRRLDAAVIYSPDADDAVEVVDTEPLTVGGTPTRFVLELANLLRIAIL